MGEDIEHRERNIKKMGCAPSNLGGAANEVAVKRQPSSSNPHNPTGSSTETSQDTTGTTSRYPRIKIISPSSVVNAVSSPFLETAATTMTVVHHMSTQEVEESQSEDTDEDVVEVVTRPQFPSSTASANHAQIEDTVLVPCLSGAAVIPLMQSGTDVGSGLFEVVSDDHTRQLARLLSSDDPQSSDCPPLHSGTAPYMMSATIPSVGGNSASCLSSAANASNFS